MLTIVYAQAFTQRLNPSGQQAGFEAKFAP
jgi:hypothetical protein